MKTTNNTNSFLASLRVSHKVAFDNGHLKAEVSRISPEKHGRQLMIRYFENVGGRWQAFSFFCSPLHTDIQKDFLSECRVFSISN